MLGPDVIIVGPGNAITSYLLGYRVLDTIGHLVQCISHLTGSHRSGGVVKSLKKVSRLASIVGWHQNNPHQQLGRKLTYESRLGLSMSPGLGNTKAPFIGLGEKTLRKVLE